jgi:competence protein ComGC
MVLRQAAEDSVMFLKRHGRSLLSWPAGERQAFTLIELLVIVVIAAVLIVVFMPRLNHERESSKRLVCASNIKGIGTVLKIYAHANQESWPVPTSLPDVWGPNDSINYLVPATGDFDRQRIPTAGYSSPTRAFWQLVRTGDITPKQFVCPTSGDTVDPTQKLDQYYDFKALKHISYGYQVPFAPLRNPTSGGADAGLAVVVADKGPYSGPKPGGLPEKAGGWDAQVTSPPGGLTPKAWRAFNSPNHGGAQTGEGQNVLYADSHATFEKLPVVGVDEDNIYTVMSAQATNAGRWSGRKPTETTGLYPGRDTYSNTSDSSTDSLIYP